MPKKDRDLLTSNVESDDESDIKQSKIMMRIIEKIRRKIGYDYTNNFDKIAFFIPFGLCHYWNPKFGLMLAKRVFPQSEWVIRTSDKHTTVWCPEENKVFDIIYWASENRLEDFIRGVPYSSNDETLGGKLALKDSALN